MVGADSEIDQPVQLVGRRCDWPIGDAVGRIGLTVLRDRLHDARGGHEVELGDASDEIGNVFIGRFGDDLFRCADLDQNAASLQVAEAQVALAQAQLQRMKLVAPFDGTVGIRTVNLGDFVKDGADLVNLEDTSMLYVDFRMPERYQGQLAVGQGVKVQIDALPGRDFSAKVQALDPLVDANGRSVLVRAVMQPGGGVTLRPGMFARVTTVFSVNDAALVVPEEALVPQGGKQLVFKIASEGEGEAAKTVVRRTEVQLGVRRGSQVQITSGLAEGDTVVVAGQQRLQKDGTLVRIVDTSKGQAGGANAAPGGAPGAPGAAPAAGDAGKGGKPADAAVAKDADKGKGKTPPPVTGENPCLRGLNAAR